MYSLNGIGTTLYGKREVNPDGSYIATKWFIFLLLPIFPMSSYRVWRGETKTTFFLPGAKTSYRMQRVKLNWRQVINTYVTIWGIIVGSIVLLSVLA
jgi:hypothetical protein